MGSETVMRNIFRILILVLIIFVSVVLLGVLYSGGVIDFAGILISKPATLVIALCILIPVYRLLRIPAPFKEAINENSLLFVVCVVLILYFGNYRTLGSSDTIPARYLPLSILREGNFDLDEFSNLHSRASSSGMVYRRNHFISSYPVGAALLASPFYLPSAIGPMQGNSRFVADLDKMAAAFLVILSVIVLYFAILQLTTHGMALLITAVYALATSSFSVSSQALWQHGPAQLCLTAALYCLVRGSKEPRWIFLAGFPTALAIACRPTDALLVIPMGLYVLFHQTKKVPGFLLFTLPPILFQILYNYYYFDNPFHTQWRLDQEGFWTTPFLEGLSGILFSPARGLFIYSPILLFSFVGIIVCWTKHEFVLLRYLSIGVLANLVLYSRFFMWWGGSTYGPRLLADLLPILCLFFYPIKDFLAKRNTRIIFIVLTAFSITAHAIGAYTYDPYFSSNLHINFNSSAAWRWTDNQLVNPVKHVLNLVRIRVLGLPTTKSNPELFDAEIQIEPSDSISVQPSKRIWITVHANNSGKAIWLDGAFNEYGNVTFQMNWYRKDRLLNQFSIRKRLRNQVFPGEAYQFTEKLIAPDREGNYDLEIVIVMNQSDSQQQEKSIHIPIQVMR
ncbi:glycosyltransferase family 39 protein [bacterium]|nr:glycosyltransferase family 39 protein [bacterium]